MLFGGAVGGGHHIDHHRRHCGRHQPAGPAPALCNLRVIWPESASMTTSQPDPGGLVQAFSAFAIRSSAAPTVIH